MKDNMTEDIFSIPDLYSQEVNIKEFIVPEFNVSSNAPFLTTEENSSINKFFQENPFLKSDLNVVKDFSNQVIVETDSSGATYQYNENDPWIQTYSGRRFTPTNPNPDSIVIQDIAHALSLMCRFNGHCNQFFSVAQHSVMVSYLCDMKDSLHGLLHDSSEAYISDFCTPLKRSGKFDYYLEVEDKLQKAIYTRFELDSVEPISVKIADQIMLATEVRDLLIKRSDWKMQVKPAPFLINPLLPEESEKLFLDRFYELFNA